MGGFGSLPLRASPMPSSVVLDVGVNSNLVRAVTIFRELKIFTAETF